MGGGEQGAFSVENSNPGASLDQSAVKAFAASSASSGVDVTTLQSSNPTYSNSRGEDNGYAAAVAAFNAWQATQKTSDAARAQYLLDASQTQGQDATKLVGPGAANPTLLNTAASSTTLLGRGSGVKST